MNLKHGPTTCKKCKTFSETKWTFSNQLPKSLLGHLWCQLKSICPRSPGETECSMWRADFPEMLVILDDRRMEWRMPQNWTALCLLNCPLSLIYSASVTFWWHLQHTCEAIHLPPGTSCHFLIETKISENIYPPINDGILDSQTTFY
jgi:hypothetical protein